jgi:hypothetical protein
MLTTPTIKKIGSSVTTVFSDEGDVFSVESLLGDPESTKFYVALRSIDDEDSPVEVLDVTDVTSTLQPAALLVPESTYVTEVLEVTEVTSTLQPAALLVPASTYVTMLGPFKLAAGSAVRLRATGPATIYVAILWLDETA